MPEVKTSPETQELQEEALEAKRTFRSKLMRQVSGELDEDETRMSPEEIEEHTKEIDELIAAAKANERMDTLEGIVERAQEDPGSINPAVLEMLGEVSNPDAERQTKRGAEVFESPGGFLRAIAAEQGLDVGHELTEEQQAKLRDLREGHNEYFNRGNRYDETIVSGKDLKREMEEKVLGGGGGSTTGGAALVPTVNMEELLRVMAEDQVFVNRARQIAMPRRQVQFPRLAQTDTSDTRPLHSIAAVSIINEGAQIDEREPAFEQFTLDAHKYAAYVEVTSELLRESIVENTQPIVTDLLTSGIAYEYDRHALRAGTGNSEPQSALGASATIEVARDTADQISVNDLFSLEEKFFGDEGIYYFHPSTLPQLGTLASDNIIAWNPDLSSGVPGTLLGREMVRTTKLNLLGDLGDLFLADPSFYLAGNLQQMSVATSTDFKFRNDLIAIRAIFQAAGAPWLGGKLSHEASGGAFVFEQSPFVALSQAVES